MTDHIDKTRNERYDFEKGRLDGFSFDDPMEQFNAWYQEAHEKKLKDPHAVTISTVDAEGQPSSRIVYMRELLDEGFVLYTNFNSRKGTHIEQSNKVSALFYWDALERQVRMEGFAEKVEDKMSDDYFASRPRMSKIGAWASEQSSQIADRKSLEDKVKFFEDKFPNEVPRPPHWGGYIIKPLYFEFWQGREGRLHDRLCYERNETDWRKFRIAP